MFRNMKLGLKLPSAERLAIVPNLLDARYGVAAQLPLIADATDYTQRLPVGLWGMLGNDQYGCCFWAAVANILMTQQANAGTPVHVYTTEDVLGWYAAATGFDPNDQSTDQGTDPIAGCQWLQQQGMIVGFGQVPIVGNDAHLAAGIELFGGLILGVQVPAGWMRSTTWGPNAGAIQGAHAIVGAGYDEDGNITAETWAEEVDLTTPGRNQYGQLAIAAVTRQWINSKGTTLQDFNLAQLRADLQLVA
jgi:hypothetical protein